MSHNGHQGRAIKYGHVPSIENQRQVNDKYVDGYPVFQSWVHLDRLCGGPS